MPNMVTLTCPKCGGKLEITEDINRFACGHCGVEHIVQRQGGLVSLAPVVQQLEKIESGTDRTATELTLARLSSEATQIKTTLDEKERLLSGDEGFLGIVSLAGQLLLGFGCLMVMSSCIGLVYGEGSIGTLLFLSLAPIAGFGTLYWKRKQGKDLEITRAEIVDLQNALSNKNNEIEHYRNLVR